MNMITAAIILFAIGAMVGIYLITFVIEKKETPKFWTFTHGIFVVSALCLLIFEMMKTGADLLQIIILFCIAALGGIILLVRDFAKKPLPIWLALTHALIAVTAFAWLLVYTYMK
jgi:hypothetical protein